MAKIYLLIIAEDHTILRKGLRSILENESDCYKVVGEAVDAQRFDCLLHTSICK